MPSVDPAGNLLHGMPHALADTDCTNLGKRAWYVVLPQ